MNFLGNPMLNDKNSDPQHPCGIQLEIHPIFLIFGELLSILVLVDHLVHKGMWVGDIDDFRAVNKKVN